MRTVWFALFLVGCNDKDFDSLGDFDHGEPALSRRRRDTPPPPPAKTRPLVIDWSGHEGVVQGGGKVSATGFEGKYHITLRDLPRHSTWKVGDKTGRVDSTIALIDLAVDDQLAVRTLDELKSFDPDATIELHLQDGRTGKAKLPPVNISHSIQNALKKVENGAVTFGKEPDDPKPEDSLFWPNGMHDRRWFGKAGKLHEIDYVLVEHKLEAKGKKVCGGYTSKGKPMPDITLQLKETEATIYERRTGKVFEKKVFAPKSECPMFTFQRAGDNETDSSTPYAEIESWARTRVKRG